MRGPASARAHGLHTGGWPARIARVPPRDRREGCLVAGFLLLGSNPFLISMACESTLGRCPQFALGGRAVTLSAVGRCVLTTGRISVSTSAAALPPSPQWKTYFCTIYSVFKMQSFKYGRWNKGHLISNPSLWERGGRCRLAWGALTV